MPPVVRKSLLKMSFVLTLLALMAFWQAEFIINAITANIFLNSCIIGTFSFGVYAAFSRVIGLKNDIIAFQSLREDYDDAANPETQGDEDPMWRFYRCKDDAKVFVTPRVLERPYTILSDEIAENQSLSISTGAMQNLLDNVDEQLDEGRSLIAYVTGLLVFLGLIGTFIGLMVTLGSVGDIIGGLDLSGGAGAEAIQGLMEDLQIPLKGMATGFSSSLFGLITSLALGLVALFGNQAASKLKGEFGTWLASVSKIGNEQKQGSGQGPASSASFAVENQRMLSIMYRTAKMSLLSNARVVATVEGVSQAATALLASQSDIQSKVSNLVGAVQRLAQSAAITNETLTEMAGLVGTREALRAEVSRLQATGDQNARVLANTINALQSLGDRHEALQKQAHEIAQKFANRDDLERLSADTKLYLQGEFSGIYGAFVELSDSIAEIDEGVKAKDDRLDISLDGLSDMSRNLREDIEWTIAETRETLALARALAEVEDGPSTLERRIEEADQAEAQQSRGLFARLRR